MEFQFYLLFNYNFFEYFVIRILHWTRWNNYTSTVLIGFETSSKSSVILPNVSNSIAAVPLFFSWLDTKGYSLNRNLDLSSYNPNHLTWKVEIKLTKKDYRCCISALFYHLFSIEHGLSTLFFQPGIQTSGKPRSILFLPEDADSQLLSKFPNIAWPMMITFFVHLQVSTEIPPKELFWKNFVMLLACFLQLTISSLPPSWIWPSLSFPGPQRAKQAGNWAKVP